MIKYVLKRFIMLIPVVLGVTFIVFFIMNLTPGDPVKMMLGGDATEETVAQLTSDLGLDKPLLQQYFRYIFNLLKGDFGRSYTSNRNVRAEIFSRIPVTLRLAVISVAICSVVALLLGTLAATHQYSALDNISMLFCLGGVSMPTFWFGMLLMLLFALKLGWFPSGGIAGWKSYFLPALSMSFNGTANIARTMRSSMLEVIHQDYVRTARAKGVKNLKVILHHAFQNAMMPVITVIGLQFGNFLGGALMTETVFSLPGMGTLMLTSIRSKDVPTVLGCIVAISVFYSVVNLIVDIIYGFIDPRIRAVYQ